MIFNLFIIFGIIVILNLERLINIILNYIKSNNFDNFNKFNRYIIKNPIKSYIIQDIILLSIMGIADIYRFGELRDSDTIFDKTLNKISLISKLYIYYIYMYK